MTAEALSARERFRLAGRRVLRAPGERAAHLQRVRAACALPGAEPLQGALADLWHACAPDASAGAALLAEPALQGRLAPFVARGFARQAASGRALPRVSTLATRWSVLAVPSLDVPPRALLCGVDDSRALAAAAVPALLAGEATAEEAFLAHCEGAGDSLAFMLARRALQRAGRPLAPRWAEVSLVLQQTTGGDAPAASAGE